MTPCGIKHVTPTMIRNGQMNIGDKIVFEDDIPVGAEISVSAEPVSAAVPVSAGAEAAIPVSAAAEAVRSGQSVTVQSAAVDVELSELPVGGNELGRSEVVVGAASAEESDEVSSARLEQGLEPAAAGTAAAEAAPTASTQLTESVADTAALQPLAYGTSSVSKNPNTVAAPNQAPPPNWPNRPDPIQYEGEDRNLISYPRMTDYFKDSVVISDSSTPTFTVPSNPMTPPEYTQTLDYDSIQYMNGFLRTQIGRFVRIEQLVGSNTIEDREGFLVGASNNYVLLQEIGTGNIMTFDLFSIKFVYIYYEEIPRPQSPA